MWRALFKTLKVLSLAGVVALVCVCAKPQPLYAFTDCRAVLSDPGRARVELARELRLDRITARDLLSEDADRGRYVASERALRAPSKRQSTLSREVPALWRLRIPRTVSPDSLRVSHILRGGGDSTVEAFTLRNDATHHLPAVVTPLRPVTICRNDTHQVVEGGVRIELDVARMPSAGRYDLAIDTHVEFR